MSFEDFVSGGRQLFAELVSDHFDRRAIHCRRNVALGIVVPEQ